MKNISERLAFAIRRSGQSKGALAAYIDVPQSSVSRWLKGTEPRADRLMEIAKFLSVDAKWLISGQGNFGGSEPQPLGNAATSGKVKELDEEDDRNADEFPDAGKMIGVLERIAAALEELVRNQRKDE